MLPLRMVVFFMTTWLQWVAAVPRNYVYQKDVSEYCRRRAVPSIFLSKHVADANAEMLYFTKLDLPYNCFISIRTESSSNIIMVIQLTSGPELVESCKDSANQLLVYEFGETFGGYWGPIPEAVVKMNRNSTTPRQYTLRTTSPTTTTTEKPDFSETEEQETPKITTTTTWRPTENADFIKVEVPLMNLSGNLVPGVWHHENSFNADENFDMLYDVTPRKDEKYLTSILPLVQFSVSRQTQAYRGRSNVEARYELDYDLGAFTPDHRLTTVPFMSTRSRTYRNRNLWKQKKRLKSKPSNAPLFSRESGTIRKSNNYILPARKHSNTQEVIAREGNAVKEMNNEDSFKLIEDLMKSLNRSSDFLDHRSQLNPSYLPIMKNISDTHFNLSAYLVPWSVYTYLPVSKGDISMTKNHNSNRWRGTTPVISTNSLQVEKMDNLKNIAVKSIGTEAAKRTYSFTKPAGSSSSFKEENHVTSSHTQVAYTVETKISKKEAKYDTATKLKEETKVIESVSNTRKSTVTSSPEKFTQSLSGSLVDHESWENVVQVAPAIAELLNQTAPQNLTRVPLAKDTPDARVTRKRRRRSIVPIPIVSARPHAHRTSYEPAATSRTQRVADMEHFAQLVELPDDEMSQRVALRFIRQYAGQVLFNICLQYEVEHKLRHLVLFNSSRIILALRNYKLSRMTVVVTTARTLRGAEPRCPEGNIECQVGGTRVCIDDTSACDGIPNCGALDIYDEDRLECGAAQGLQHNVYLAAFTFLALLLTGLYIVHYWLKRCVPKVADAFFVYTDGTENVLYLGTIMRSPTGFDISTKNDGENLFEDNMYSYSYNEMKRKSIGQRLRSKFLKIMNITRKRDSILLEAENEEKIKPDSRKMYSFAELEIQNISRILKVDEEVQTGESLEMAFLKMINSKNLEAPLGNTKKPPGVRRFQQPFGSSTNKDRNNYITFKSSTHSAGPSSVASLNFGQLGTTADNEKELENTLYDRQDEQFDDDSKVYGSTSTQARKRLRFDKETRLISATDIEEVGGDAPSGHRQSVVLPQMSRPPRRNINTLDIASQDQEPAASEFRSFFTGKRIKKKKDQK